MKTYNFLRALPLAFYSKAFYRDVGQNWRGLGLSYLLLLCAICALPYTYGIYHRVIVPYVTAIQPLVAQLPTITIKQGVVSIDKSEPYFIKSSEQGNRVIMIIDTQAKPDSLAETSAFALLSKDKVAVKQGDAIKTYEISKRRNAVYTPSRVERLLHYTSYWLTGIVYLLSALIYFLLGLIEALLYAGIIKFFADVNFSYKALVRLAVVALTPVFILAAILHLSGYCLPYRWLIYIPLSFAYLLYGMRASWQRD